MMTLVLVLMKQGHSSLSLNEGVPILTKRDEGYDMVSDMDTTSPDGVIPKAVLLKRQMRLAHNYDIRPRLNIPKR